MSDYLLLRSQKNDVLESVKSSGLDPYNFKWSEEESKYTLTSTFSGHESVERLIYGDVGFYFQFDFHERKHFAIFSPGKEKLVDEEYPGDWENQHIYVRSWLTYLKRELEQSDLWAALYKYRLSPDDTLTTDMGNEPFTIKETEQLSEGIRRVRAYIEDEFHLNEDQRNLVNEKLDYLLEAVKRQGRKDWLYTSIGVVFTLASTMAFSPEQTKKIWNILKGAISGIIYLLR